MSTPSHRPPCGKPTLRVEFEEAVRRACHRAIPQAVGVLLVRDVLHRHAKRNACARRGKFHDLLLEFYGEKRLRYVYLVRDPRDVAMSFMKT